MSYNVTNIFVVFHVLLLYINKSAKYEKRTKYWSYCTWNRATTHAYFEFATSLEEITNDEISFTRFWETFYEALRKIHQNMNFIWSAYSHIYNKYENTRTK